jgi:antitoxin component YwqK of YwqJK toxin-antitoxin module
MNRSLRKEEKKVNKKEILKRINSLIIFKKLFLFLEEKKKLNLIIYNKKYKKKLGIDLEYYKKISGKYIDGERNGYGKEYTLYKNKLIFEGEYKDGKRNGFGKEYYDNGNLKYEGEYSRGRRFGKGKLYNKYNSNIIFNGEY